MAFSIETSMLSPGGMSSGMYHKRVLVMIANVPPCVHYHAEYTVKYLSFMCVLVAESHITQAYCYGHPLNKT